VLARNAAPAPDAEDFGRARSIWPTAELGPGRSEPCDGSGRELCEGRVALRELVRNAKHVDVRVDSDDSLALEVAEDAGARDLKGVRNIAR
jgi:hypothetical protein